MPKKHDKVLYEALIEKGLIPKDTLEPLFKVIDVSGDSLQQLLVKRGILPEKDILIVFAEKLKLSYVNLPDVSIEKGVLSKVPIKIASYYKFVPVEIKGRTLTIAVSSPLDIKTRDEIRTQLGYNIETVLSCENDIVEGLKRYYGLAADTLDKITSSTTTVSASLQEPPREKMEDIEKLAGDASVIKLVNQIILEAYRKRATDIHLEPYRQGLSLRYRIDGVLYDSPVPPEIKNFLNSIISRIKIMCNLNIVERRLPQDGRTSVKIQDRIIDLRISIIPTPYGESVVIRILPTQMLFSLAKLGLPARDLEDFESLVAKPHGIIFVTGPTGSGKTTTLYACLTRINTKDRKIITIEDPIEYEMAGITQIQVMSAIGLDFARGLRSVLRHDPDIMMIGEVRDLETAEIAIRIALTGHLVFSTLHTNDAASGIARLLDIGLEPYLVASSVEAFIAQRLVRVICPHCKQEDKAELAELRDQIKEDLKLKSKDEVRIFKAKGCENCNFSGFFGRTAIYEILLMDDLIKDLIAKRISSSEIKKVAIRRGMRTLREGGWEKVIEGVTTPDEVMRVSPATEAPVVSGESAALIESKPDIPSKSKDVSSVKDVSALRKAQEDNKVAAQKIYDPKPSDRRVYTRIDYTVNIRYKVFKSKDEISRRKDIPEHVSVTKNISAGGLLFVSNDPLPIGAYLELKIELLDGKNPIECLAKIVRITQKVMDKQYEVAVCYLDITSAERNRLSKLCKSV